MSTGGGHNESNQNGGLLTKHPSLKRARRSSTTTSTIQTRLISGSIGSIVTALIVHPLEVIKVRLQTEAATTFSTTTKSTLSQWCRCPASCGGASQPPPPPPPTSPSTFFRPMVVVSGGSSSGSCLCAVDVTCLAPSQQQPRPFALPQSSFPSVRNMARQILTESSGNISGLYVGIRPTLFMAVPNMALYLTLYEEIMDRVAHRNYNYWGSSSSLSSTTTTTTLWWSPLVAGGTARMMTSTVTAPLELLRTRAAAAGAPAGVVTKQRPVVGNLERTTVFADVKHVIQNEGGIRGLFRGLGPTLARDVPFSAVYWFTIEQLRHLWRQHHHHHEEKLLSWQQQLGQEFVNGAIGGMVAAAVTTPFDVVKTRHQSGGYHKQATTRTTGPFSLWTELQTIARHKGMAALWSGNMARMLKVAPSCAIMISSYELGKRLLHS